MNPFSRPAWLGVGIATLILAGCATTPMSRIDANRTAYESWPIEVREAILDGRAIKGMTPEMVRVALGAPSRVEPRSTSTSNEEVWVYDKSSSTTARSGAPNIGIGGSIGGLGVSSRGRRGGGGSRGGGGTGSDAEQVVFENGVW